MAVKFFSCLAHGMEGHLVEVEVDILQGLSAFSIVGLGDTAVQEAKERIRSAIKNSGFKYPQTKKVINLAPAHIRKHGPQFDLPMAAGLIAASGQMGPGSYKDALIAGELALDGSVRPINGIITMMLFARANGFKKVVIPKENVEEASLVKGVEILPIGELREISELKPCEPPERRIPTLTNQNSFGNCPVDFSDIHGHEQAKRALTIAAAGGHHLIFTGPPGTGKTLLAKALSGILPPAGEEEMFQIMQIYSCAGMFNQLTQQAQLPLLRQQLPARQPQELSPQQQSPPPENAAPTSRPFRQVHPSCSLLSLIGGGSVLTPGEVSLAHRGILFLDEIAEFPRAHLESLRTPLEEKEIVVSRVAGVIKYPAAFTLIASMNPCPCGFYGDPAKECKCRPWQIIRYRKKLSGPILDRLDLFVEVPRQPMHRYSSETGETSGQIRITVSAARQIQHQRFKNSFKVNSEITAAEIKKLIPLTEDCKDFIAEAGERFNFSGRNYHQILKTARTIADLAAKENVQINDLAEALQYRHNMTGAFEND
jgi:magnesium chelatase family protein